MAKRLLSVILAVMLLLTTAVVAHADGEKPDNSGKKAVIYFNAESIGWTNIKYVGFHIWEINGEPFSDWGGKAERGTQVLEYDDEGAVIDTPSLIWQFDFAAKGVTLEDGKQYGVIFYNDKGDQTYNLLFDTTCFEDTADCDTTNTFENPEDSEKVAYPAYWRNQDPAVNGPELKITSIGNVVGSCMPKGTTGKDMMVEFLEKTLDNARKFSGLGDQEIIDNIGKQIGLNKNDVEEAIAETGVQTNWDAEKSTLPDAEEPILSGNVINFDAKTAGWADSAYIGFHIWEYEGDPFFDWGSRHQRGTDEDGDGVWTYDLDENGIELDPEKHYGVVFYNENAEAQTYNLMFDTACFGDTAYCADESILENPVDSDKETKVAYWKNQDPTVNGPEMIVTSIGTVIGFCIPKGVTAFDLFLDFLLYNLETAEVYSGLTQHQLIENVGKGLELTVEDVQDAIRIAGVEVTWDSAKSELEHYEPEPGDSSRVALSVDVTEGEGTAVADKKYLVICYSLPPEYAYDTVTLTAEPADYYVFAGWEIEGNYEIDGDYTLEYEELPLKAHGEIKAHAKFMLDPRFYDPDKVHIDDGQFIMEAEKGDTVEFLLFTAADKPIGALGGSIVFDTNGLALDEESLATAINAGREKEIYTGELDRPAPGAVGFALVMSEGADYAGACNYQIDVAKKDEVIHLRGMSVLKLRFTVTADSGLYKIGTFIDSAAYEDGAAIDVSNEDIFGYGTAIYMPQPGENKRGDYDGDGEITILDATRAQRILAELEARPDENLLVAIDADRDGVLTIMDATRIQRVLAELCDFDGNPLLPEGRDNGDTEPQIPTEKEELPYIPA